jgi:hypothetical protein
MGWAPRWNTVWTLVLVDGALQRVVVLEPAVHDVRAEDVATPDELRLGSQSRTSVMTWRPDPEAASRARSRRCLSLP